MKLLLENNLNKIIKISDKIVILNNKRKKIQKNIFKLLNDRLNLSNKEIIFLYEKNINEGIIGIIAANFVEIYNKPTFILTTANNYIKCSSRSVFGFNIGQILNEALNKNIIVKGGGHSMAGGCSLNYDKINIFKKFLNEKFRNIKKNIKFNRNFISEQSLDSLIIFAKHELKLLEPFGNFNSLPTFIIRKNKILKYKLVNNSHLQLIVINNLKKTCLCYAFNAVDSKLGYILMNYKKELDLIVQINNKNIQKNSDFNLIIKDAIV